MIKNYVFMVNICTASSSLFDQMNYKSQCGFSFVGFFFFFENCLRRLSTFSHRKNILNVPHHSELDTMVILRASSLNLCLFQTFLFLRLLFLHRFCTHWLSDLNP